MYFSHRRGKQNFFSIPCASLWQIQCCFIHRRARGAGQIAKEEQGTHPLVWDQAVKQIFLQPESLAFLLKRGSLASFRVWKPSTILHHSFLSVLRSQSTPCLRVTSHTRAWSRPSCGPKSLYDRIWPRSCSSPKIQISHQSEKSVDCLTIPDI